MTAKRHTVTIPVSGLTYKAQFTSEFRFVLLAETQAGRFTPIQRSNTRSKLTAQALSCQRSGRVAVIFDQTDDRTVSPRASDIFVPGE